MKMEPDKGINLIVELDTFLLKHSQQSSPFDLQQHKKVAAKTRCDRSNISSGNFQANKLNWYAAFASSHPPIMNCGPRHK